MDFLEQAKKRLRLLEASWLYLMSFGTLAVTAISLISDNGLLFAKNYAMPSLFFLLFGLMGVPFLIAKAIPIWNLFTPGKNRKTVWKTELIVSVITLTCLAWASSCFFGVSFEQAAKVQLLLGLMLSPLLQMTASQRWKVHLMETPKQTGYVNEAVLWENKEYESRKRKNVKAYVIASIAATAVQTIVLALCLLLMKKIEVFSFFSSLVIISFVINLIILPLGMFLTNNVHTGKNLRPGIRLFIGSTLFTLGSVLTPYALNVLNAFNEKKLHLIELGSVDAILGVILSTYILGYLIGAMFFEKLYKAEPKSLNFT